MVSETMKMSIYLGAFVLVLLHGVVLGLFKVAANNSYYIFHDLGQLLRWAVYLFLRQI